MLDVALWETDRTEDNYKNIREISNISVTPPTCIDSALHKKNIIQVVFAFSKPKILLFIKRSKNAVNYYLTKLLKHTPTYKVDSVH